MSDRSKGVATAVTAAFFAATFYIPFKALGAEVPRLVAVAALLLCAAVFNSGAALIRWRRSGGSRGRGRANLVAAPVLALFTLTGNLAVISALGLQEPAVTSVIIQTQVLWMALAEFAFLGEPITRRFAVGAGLTLSGFAVMNLGPGAAAAASAAGIVWALLAAASFASMQVYTRAVIRRIDPVVVNASRLWFAGTLLLLWPGTLAGLVAMPPRAWALAIGAAAAGPFVSRLFLMATVRFIPASHGALITMINPLFAFFLGYAAFRVFPEGREIVGGAVILAGVMLPLIFKLRATARSRAAP